MATQEHLGICKLPFSCLSLGPKNPVRVRKLLRDFKHRGCHRDWPSNFISVVVSSDQFTRSFHPDEGWDSEFDNFRTLKGVSLERSTLEVLDGSQRVYAATEMHRRGVKARQEHWWIAHVYLKDAIEHSTKVHIKRTYTITELSPGDQYRQQRMCHLGLEVRPPGAENADFTISVTDSMVRKLKTFSKDSDYQAAFDALLPVKGLWEGFQLGNTNNLTAIKCKEEVLNYLCRIKDIWYYIGGRDVKVLDLFDADSVTFLEGEGPALSSAAQKSITNAMNKGRLFPNIHDPQLRESITKRILSICCPIPTIRSLFMDLRFLYPLSKRMLELQKLLVISEDTASWVDANTCTIREIFLDTRVDEHGEGFRDSLECDYLELWLFLIRNFAELSGEKPRSGHKKTERGELVPKICEYRWAEFLDLARFQGYVLTEEVIPTLTDLLVRDIGETLQRAGKDVQESRILDFINSISGKPRSTFHGPNVSFVGNISIKKFLRMGPPSKEACEIAKTMLYTENLLLDTTTHEKGFDISEFCILHSFFINFFWPNSQFCSDGIQPTTPMDIQDDFDADLQLASQCTQDPRIAAPQPMRQDSEAEPTQSLPHETQGSDRQSTPQEAQGSDRQSTPQETQGSDRLATPPGIQGLDLQSTPQDQLDSEQSSSVDVASHWRDAVLVLGILLHGGRHIHTRWWLVFTVPANKVSAFYKEIGPAIESHHPDATITFKTNDSRIMPIEQLASGAESGDAAVFGVICLANDSDPFAVHETVIEHNLLETVVLSVQASGGRDERLQMSRNTKRHPLNWLSGWVEELGGSIKPVEWLTGKKRRFPFESNQDAQKTKSVRRSTRLTPAIPVEETLRRSTRLAPSHRYEVLNEHGEVVL